MNIAILDRDGVINLDSAEFVKNADEWIPIEGSLEAIARLKQAGWLVVIATNQSGIGRGLFSIKDLNAMHLKFKKLLAKVGGHIDGIIFCPHTDDENCSCRKPKPGMFNQILTRYDISASKAYAVGDSLRDLQAAAAAGCHTSLVLTGNGVKTRDGANLPANTTIYPNLSATVDAWLTGDAQ